MPFSTVIDNRILDHFTGKTTWSPPAAIYAGLSSTTPTKAGTNITEPTTGSYARVQITAAQFATAVGSATENNTEKVFPTATADWLSGANLTHLVLFDYPTSGLFLGFKQFVTPYPVLLGQIAKLLSGSLDLSIGGT